MNQHEKDPFEKYDKLFDEADKKSVVQPVGQKTYKPHSEEPNKPIPDEQKKKAVSVIFSVFFFIIIIQFLPFIFRDSNFLRMFPIFSFIFVIVIINIIIKAFKR